MTMSYQEKLRYLWWSSTNNQAFGTSLLEDPAWDRLNRLEISEVSEILGSLEGNNALELGAGIGRYSAQLAKKCRCLHVVEFVPELLERNQRRNASFSNIKYVCEDVVNLDYPPETFDLVFSSWLLMYLSDQEIATLVEKTARWLKPGGRVFFRESCEYNYTGHTLWNLFTMEWLRTLTPFGGRAIYRVWNFRLPPLRAIWNCLRTGDLTLQRFRKAADYERIFNSSGGRLTLVRNDYLRAYEEVFDSRYQRYWVLEK